MTMIEQKLTYVLDELINLTNRNELDKPNINEITFLSEKYNKAIKIQVQDLNLEDAAKFISDFNSAKA